MTFALMETSRVFGRMNAVIRPEWLEQVAPHVCSRGYDMIAWDEESGFVYARERVTAGQLIIHPGRRCHYAKINPAEARTVFIREALVTGRANLRGSWLEEYHQMLQELKLLEIKMRRPDSIVDTDAIYAHFDGKLPKQSHSLHALKQDWAAHSASYAPEMEEIMLIPFEELHEKDYPDFLSCAGQRFRLRYVFDPGEEQDGLFLDVREDYL